MTQTSAAPEVQADQYDLFDGAGYGRATRPRTLTILTRRVVARTGWTLYSKVELWPRPRPLAIGCEPEQLSLDLNDRSDRVVHLTPDSFSTYLNARLTSFLRSDRRLYNAALRLRRHGLLYVGDLVRLRRHELECKLGDYRDRLEQVEAELAEVGLSLNTRASNWARPTDYYR